MAEIAEGNGKAGHEGKKRAKKQSTRVDMTPMVDLAFLLLTFFVLTSTFSKPKAMELSMPADNSENPPPVKNGLTFLLTKDNKIFYYSGEFYESGNKKGMPPTMLQQTDFSTTGLRKILLERNAWVIKSKKQVLADAQKNGWTEQMVSEKVNQVLGDTAAVTVLVKTDDEATYKNAVDMLDELKICDVGKRVIGVEMMPAEYDLLKEKIK